MRVLIVVIGVLGMISVVQGSSCQGIPGTCKNYKTAVCTAGYETGRCPGSSDIRCCKPCDFACKLKEATYIISDAKCRSSGGKCMRDSNYCDGTWHSGRCGGPSARKCCVPKVSPGDEKCHAAGGTCKSTTSSTCAGSWQSGKCSGSATRKCCVPSSPAPGDEKCHASGGTCKSTTSTTCAGSWESGKCSGAATRKCCVPSSSGSGACNLITYTASNVKGNAGKIVRVASDFKGAMDTINQYAKDCGVVVMVTDSYRVVGKPVSGAIVTPAKKSNHFVGHAIDMNLSTPKGWCNSSCLSKKTNSDAVCFTNKVVAGPLRWGESFNDPVHIDDALNINQPSVWLRMFNAMQRNC